MWIKFTSTPAPHTWLRFTPFSTQNKSTLQQLVFIWAKKVAASKFQRAYIFYAIFKQFKYEDRIKILLKNAFIISLCTDFSCLPRKFVGSEKIQAQVAHSPIDDIPPMCLARFWQVLFQRQGQKLDWKCS